NSRPQWTRRRRAGSSGFPRTARSSCSSPSRSELKPLFGAASSIWRRAARRTSSPSRSWASRPRARVGSGGAGDAPRRTIGRRIAMDRMNAEPAASRTRSSSGSHSSRNAVYVSRKRGMVTSRFLMTLLSLILALLTQPCRSAEIQAGQVDAIVQEALKAWQVPGTAVAIVRGDEVIYLNGHGVRELRKPGPGTPEPLFAIGSTTKAFTATAVGILVDDGKMAWDDLVRKHVEFFHLADPLADANVTLRDLLCHRTGLGLHELLWHGSPLGREELIR